MNAWLVPTQRTLNSRSFLMAIPKKKDPAKQRSAATESIHMQRMPTRLKRDTVSGLSIWWVKMERSRMVSKYLEASDVRGSPRTTRVKNDNADGGSLSLSLVDHWQHLHLHLPKGACSHERGGTRSDGHGQEVKRNRKAFLMKVHVLWWQSKERVRSDEKDRFSVMWQSNDRITHVTEWVLRRHCPALKWWCSGLLSQSFWKRWTNGPCCFPRTEVSVGDGEVDQILERLESLSVVCSRWTSAGSQSERPTESRLCEFQRFLVESVFQHLAQTTIGEVASVVMG